MISKDVLTALNVYIDKDGDVVTMPKTHPDFKDAEDFEQVGIYALSTQELDSHCKSDANITRFGLGSYLGFVTVPYKLIKPHVNFKNPQLNLGNMVRYAIDFCHACLIGGRVAFLELPDDEHALRVKGKSNVSANNRRLCDIPGLCSNFYLTGESGALRLLNRVLPNRSSGEAQEFLRRLYAALEYRDDLKFELDDSVVTFRNGCAFRIDRFATDPDKVWQQLPPVTPEDHILWSSRLPVDYEPFAPVDPVVDKVLEGWSGSKDSDKWWRNIETNFASLMLPTVDYKGMSLNIGPGGAGMSSINDVRAALFGEDSIFYGTISELAGEFGIGYLAGKRAFVSDETNDGKLNKEAVQKLKSLSTGQKLQGKIKFEMATVDVRGTAIIINSNEFPGFSQREARHNAIPRRVQTVLHNTIFDDANIADASKRKKRPDLIYKICHDSNSLSYLLNLVIEATKRVIIRRGYTPVEEDIQFTKRALGEQDVIGDFIESIGGIFGEEWDKPRLYHFSPNDEALLYPAWHRGDELVEIVDMADTKVIDLTTPFCFKTDYSRHFVFETSILYKLYSNYCKNAGSVAILNLANFKTELLRSGYTEIRVRDPWWRNPRRLIVPEDTVASTSGLAAFRDVQRSKHEYRGAGEVVDQPPALPSKWDVIYKTVHDTENLADETGNPKEIATWLQQFDGKSIDDVVNSDDFVDIDHTVLMDVLRVGIRAVQLTYNFDEDGIRHMGGSPYAD